MYMNRRETNSSNASVPDAPDLTLIAPIRTKSIGRSSLSSPVSVPAGVPSIQRSNRPSFAPGPLARCQWSSTACGAALTVVNPVSTSVLSSWRIRAPMPYTPSMRRRMTCTSRFSGASAKARKTCVRSRPAM